MASVQRDEIFTPRPGVRTAYDELFAEYLRLHDYFGRGGNDVMKRLRGN
jgi:L-ribulokinase